MNVAIQPNRPDNASQLERKPCEQIAKALGECYLMNAIPFFEGISLIDAMKSYNENERKAMRLEYLTICYQLRTIRTGELFERYQFIKGLIEKGSKAPHDHELLEALEDEIERRDRRLGI